MQDSAGQDERTHSKISSSADSQQRQGTGASKNAAELEGADEIPEDLQPSASATEYDFPDSRRRAFGAALVGLAGIAVMLGAMAAGGPYATTGAFIGGIACLVVSAYIFACSWKLHVSEDEAILTAARSVSFPVGPASVSIGFRGWRSRPEWRILLYSAELPRPRRRGLVVVDAVDKTVLAVVDEENPEED